MEVTQILSHALPNAAMAFDLPCKQGHPIVPATLTTYQYGSFDASQLPPPVVVPDEALELVEQEEFDKEYDELEHQRHVKQGKTYGFGSGNPLAAAALAKAHAKAKAKEGKEYYAFRCIGSLNNKAKPSL